MELKTASPSAGALGRRSFRPGSLEAKAAEGEISRLGPWFHNIHLPNGVQTAPAHFLGDFPSRKWAEISAAIPEDLTGWRCLDIGCNAGFYSFELAKRGAKVLGIDSEPLYLNQARWIAENFWEGEAPEFRQMQIHDLSRVDEGFDLVLFMGVFYHLRYPSLALDTVSRLVKKMMIFQTLTSDNVEGRDYTQAPVFSPADDYLITNRAPFQEKGWPQLSFIEKKYSNDYTNWFVPNHAAVEAMLRSTGFCSIDRIAHEVYVCKAPQGAQAARQWPDDEWRSATGSKARIKDIDSISEAV